jgi:hypothetical protein
MTERALTTERTESALQAAKKRGQQLAQPHPGRQARHGRCEGQCEAVCCQRAADH